MVEAQAQLAEFEKQKAGMTPQQLAMMESIMGPQLKMIENMAQGKGIQFETVVDRIQVNPVLTDAMGQACDGSGNQAIVVVETPSAGVDTKPVKSAATPEALQAAQQACLQQKMEAAQAAQQKKRGFGSLMRGVGRMAGQFGNNDLAQTTADVYQAEATVEDFSQAAKDLGLTEDDIAACQNPG